ncbi:ABC transporter ATP-binding protein [Brevundimonas sp.]|uniref:ABC transporter ATP-binding protein n=1 Tax=Brevundimonas sp. TaxID=1871086 RepID=UPI003BAA0448
MSALLKASSTFELPDSPPSPHAQSPEVLVRVEAVSKVFSAAGQSNTAVADVSLDIQTGQFVSLVGRSGSGKSTLLRLIAGLLTPSSGALSVEGAPVTRPPASARYVFQDYGESLFPWLSAHDNVAFGARSAGDGRAEARDAATRYLEMVGLSDAAGRYPWELSGGMQQRLAIARALASRPRLLLMDEPFGAVDALSRTRLQDLILSLWAELGLTVVLVTHDIDEAVYLSDRVVVLDPTGQGIRADLAIDIPRPRAQLASRENARFALYRRELHGLVLG